MWIIFPTIFVVLYAVLTIAFCFWFVFLLQAVITKRSCYRTAKFGLQERNDPSQQQVVHDAETCYVLSVSLFSINIIEWVTITLFAAAYIYVIVKYGWECSRHTTANGSFNLSADTNLSISHCITQSIQTSFVNSKIRNFLVNSGYNLILLSLTLIACLCNYLTARYAKVSWIKSDKIPFYIILVLVIMLLAQLTTLFCFLTLIVRYVHLVITSAALVVAIQQARRLRMVVEWMIVDLEISQTNKTSLQRLRLMSKRLKILFTILFLGVGFLLIAIGSTVNIRTEQVPTSVHSP